MKDKFKNYIKKFTTFLLFIYTNIIKDLFICLWGGITFWFYFVLSYIYYFFNLTIGRAIERLDHFIDDFMDEVKDNPEFRKKVHGIRDNIYIWVDYIVFHNFFLCSLIIFLIGGLFFGWQLYINIAMDTRSLLYTIYNYQPFNLFDYWRVITFWLFIFFTGASKFLGFQLDIRAVALNFSLFFFAVVILLIANYEMSSSFVISLTSVQAKGVLWKVVYHKWNIFVFGYDGLSLAFLVLTTFIFPIVILTAWDRITIKPTLFYFNIIFIELLVIGAFLALDLFLFFIFFELIFVPIALLIYIWGGRQRKIKAASYLLMYALFSSVFFLIGILWIQKLVGSTNLFFIMENLGKIGFKESRAIWLLLFIPFAVKIPMFPFHIWLPEAHVEAPTSGSIILASILLKLGGYGIIRFLFTIFHEASIHFSMYVCFFALLSAVFASLIALRQTDFKKVIAYSSIIHMNLAVVGLFTFNINAIYGSIMLMLGHGIVSSALFFLVGVLYDRHHTRTISYYGGLAQVMPLFTSFFFFFIIANFGFPCSLSFIGELAVFLGVYDKLGVLICLIIGFCSVIGTCVNIQLFTSLCYGTLNCEYGSVYQDLTPKELSILLILTFVSLFTFIFHAPLSTLLSQSNAIFIHLFI